MFQNWLTQLIGSGCRYHSVKNTFPQETLLSLKEGIQNSPFLAPNVLNERFSSTLGFSIVFKAAHVSSVLQYFDYLNPLLKRIVQTKFNVYYLNALVLSEKAKVDRHIDHSIRGYNANLPFPKQVSVFYVNAPAMEGGELVLYNRQNQVEHKIKPKTNSLLTFPGHIKHGIEAIEKMNKNSSRMSLVCEQYCFGRAQLDYVPDFAIKSTTNFQTFLEQQET